MSSILRDKMANKLKAGQYTEFETPEEYYFSLGQFLVFVFYLLGGVQQHTKEFNYLTNPYLPMDVHQLGARVVRFLSKLPLETAASVPELLELKYGLIEQYNFFCNAESPLTSCTEAFFEGIHGENLFLQLIKTK